MKTYNVFNENLQCFQSVSDRFRIVVDSFSFHFYSFSNGFQNVFEHVSDRFRKFQIVFEQFSNLDPIVFRSFSDCFRNVDITLSSLSLCLVSVTTAPRNPLLVVIRWIELLARPPLAVAS